MKRVVVATTQEVEVLVEPQAEQLLREVNQDLHHHNKELKGPTVQLEALEED